MPESQTASRSGLLTREEVPVPLDGVSLDAEVSSFCARVAVTQRYVNRESQPIEAVYVFPVDEGAAVCGFEAIIDGTLVVGEVQDRDKAFEMYDDAMQRGAGGFLLDEERPDVFQASIGNLPPGKEVLVRLTYVTELSIEGSGLRFAIPTTVSPRYAPSQDRAGVGRPDSETLNPALAWSVPYGLNLSIRLAMTGAIARLASPSHPISVALNGSEATVTLNQREAALDRDFVLEVEADGIDVPQAWLERGEDGTSSIAVAFVPRLTDAASPKEVIFVVDRSGSMGGTSIREVRNALQFCLRSMIPGCRFNIVGFGSTFAALFPECRSYDGASLTEASAHVAALEADLGGTEILPALQFVLEQSAPGAVRQVVVLTDGQVTNTDEVLALVRKHSASARIFTLGIGAGASHHLVKGLARAGRGTAEFIFPGERIEPKVVRQFVRLLSPVLTNVRMDWGGLDVTQAPSDVPPIFAGGRLLLYGFLKTGLDAARPSTVRLSADAPSGPLAFDVHVDPARAVSGRTVSILAARARIRELEEGEEWTSGRGSRQRERKASRVTGEIIELSKRFGLISRETSYVAIERRETPVHGDVQLRRVPVALTTGWGGLQEAAIGTLGMRGAFRLKSAHLVPGSFPKDAAVYRAAPRARALEGAMGRSADAAYDEADALESRRIMRPLRDQTIGVPAPPAMHALVALQHAEGTWDLTYELAAVIGCDMRRLERELDGATGRPEDVRKAWATALALAWLRAHGRDAEEEWRLLAAKARRWLDDVEAVPPGRGAWVDAAAEFLRTV